MIARLSCLVTFLFFIITPSLSREDSREKTGVTIRVTVSNIPGVKGQLLVGLYDSERTFTKKALPNSRVVPVTSTRNVTVEIPNVKPGTYAISVIQDLNRNGKLDKSFAGMPKEPLAFSVIRRIPRGKPKFSDCTFTVGSRDVSMRIPLVTE